MSRSFVHSKNSLKNMSNCCLYYWCANATVSLLYTCMLIPQQFEISSIIEEYLNVTTIILLSCMPISYRSLNEYVVFCMSLIMTMMHEN